MNSRSTSPSAVWYLWTAVLPIAALVTGILLAMSHADEVSQSASTEPPSPESKSLRKATFGGGCFWCTEAVFKELAGVRSVVSGYSGGHVENPTYREICTGTTGHAEVIQVTYDPQTVSYDELLEVFWKTHDPSTLNRQGNDIGTQYRSVVFYHDEEQQKTAEDYMKKLDQSGAFERPIVTQIAPLEKFYPAEDYHQDYYALNREQGYCQIVIRPKMEKFRKVFADKLRKAGGEDER